MSEDSTVEELLEKCGEPTTKTTETIDVHGPSDAGGGNIKRGTLTIETWTYDRGSQSFPMVVTIENGKLKSVESAGQGSAIDSRSRRAAIVGG